MLIEARHRGGLVSENTEERDGQIWLERGIASARSGRRSEARQALFRALNYESQREMCWLWLAAVSEDAQQERVYLNKVLTLNSNNRFARAGLAHLDAQAAENGATVQPAGASALGLIEAEPVVETREPAASAPGAAFKVSADKPGSSPTPRGESPAAQPKAAQSTTQEAIPNRMEPTAVAPAAELPRRRPAKLPAVERRVAPPATSAADQTPSGPSGKNDGELSGWTVGRKPVPPLVQGGDRRPKAEAAQVAEPSGWTRSVPKAAAALQPRASRYEVNPRPENPVHPDGRFSGALSEVFRSHETWTAMVATASLVGLAFILIVLTVISVVH
jgi:hypothetical protein